MSKVNLEFTVVIEADETTVNEIKNVLADTEAEGASLTDVLAGMIEKKVSETEVAGDFTVKLPHSRILIKPVLKEGGLSAQEWLEKGKLSDYGRHLPKEGFQD